MARKNYSEEFRRQTVDLCETTPGATVRGITERKLTAEREILQRAAEYFAGETRW